MRRFRRRFYLSGHCGGAFEAEMSKQADKRMRGEARARMVALFRSLGQARLVLQRGRAHASDKIQEQWQPNLVKQFAQRSLVKERRGYDNPGLVKRLTKRFSKRFCKRFKM